MSSDALADSAAGEIDKTTYFSGLAETYAQHRPSYPREAIEFILSGLPRPLEVADIGCGTGISTRLLAGEPGVAVVGIDPNDDMLQQARAADAGTSAGRIRYQSGTGEATGLPTASVDVVVCAQSFHWFKPLIALREFHRILRPGGRLALMWNIKDDRDAFTAAYYRVAERAQADAAARGMGINYAHHADPSQGGWFDQVRVESFANQVALDRAGVLGRIRSASYFPRQGALRLTLEHELMDAFDRCQHDGVVIMHYRTEVTVAAGRIVGGG